MQLCCPRVPDGTPPNRSHLWCPTWPGNKAESRSRRCRPLSGRCGTAGSAHSGLCSSLSFPTTRGPGEQAKTTREPAATS